MHKDCSYILLYLGLAFFTAGCVHHSITTSHQIVSFADVKLEHDEYVQHIEVSIKHGHVVSANRFLDDWDTEVQWDNPNLQFVNLQARHFSNGLANVHKLDGFITVSPDDAYFDIKVTLSTESTDPTGRAPRTIVLGKSQLVFKPQNPE